MAFDVINVETEQPGAEVRIQVTATSVFYTLSRLFATSDERIFGVVGGAKPFRVMPPGWTTGVVGQAVPFPGAANTLTVSLQSTINLEGQVGADGSSVTISNLAGAIADPSGVAVTVFKDAETLPAAIFCIPSAETQSVGGNYGVWDQATGTLVLKVCAGQTLEAIARYVLRFAVTNPDLPQPAPSISIAATGTATFLVEALDQPGADASEVFGVVGGVDAMFVILPAFEARSIAQNSIFPSGVNLITVTIHSNVDLAEEHDAIISLCCFSNAIVASDILPIHVSGDGLLPELCMDAAGTGGSGQVHWDAETYGIRMHLCPEPGNTVSSRLEFVVSFNVTNPPTEQSPPTISISASATAPASGIALVATETPGFAILGATRGTDPMRVVVPEFVARTASQSTPVSGAANKITLELQVSVDLSGADASVIVLSDFTGAGLDPVVTLEAVSGGNSGVNLFCGDDGTSRLGEWDSVASTLTLRFCPEQTMHVGQKYAIALTITNPADDQESPRLMIEARGDFVQTEAAPLVKSTATVLGIEAGASPLKVVVPLFTTKRIAQSTPISSVSNVITVTLQSTIDLSSSMSAAITISNLQGLVQAGSQIAIQDVLGGTPFSGLMCSGAIPYRAGWDQTEVQMVLTVCAGETMLHSTDYVFSFTITNPGRDQTSPAIRVGAYTTMAVITDSRMDTPHARVVGVVNGSDPLRIVVPIFNEKLVSQSTPLPGFDNTLTLLLRSSINLAASDLSVITISGFSGAVSNATASFLVLKNGLRNVHLFCEADSPAGGNYGVWNQEDNRTLVLKVCSGQIFEAGASYEVRWVVQNPQDAQASPSISIKALGTARFLLDAVDKPGTDLLGVSNGVDPLLVITPTFVAKVLAQSNFLAEEENLITATLMTNVDVGSAGYAFISICCLDAAATSGTEVAVQVRSTGNAGLPRFCGGFQGSGEEGFGVWNSSSFAVSFHLCGGAANMVESFSEYVVSFSVTNPAWNQDSPAVSVLANDYFRIAEAGMTKPGVIYSGVQFGSDPLKVVVPEFFNRSIGQSSPFDSAVNRISVTLVSTVQLSGANLVNITMTGLNAGPQTWTHVTMEGADAGLFCSGTEPAVSSRATYNASTGVVHMMLCPSAVFHAERVHRISFELTNPHFDQPSSINLIAAQSLSTVPVESFGIRASAMTVQGQTVWDVVNATDPVRVLYPTFVSGYMAQSNFYGGEQNFLSLEFSTNVQLGCSAVLDVAAEPTATYCNTITVQGLLGAQLDRDVALIGNDAALFCDDAGAASSAGLWDQATAELTMWLCPGKTVRAYTKYAVTFNITNPMLEQSSPAVRLSATGPVPLHRVFLAKPNALYLGVVNGTNPLEVVIPRFLVQEIRQDNPVDPQPSTPSHKP